MDEKGFTLVEAMMAMVVLSIGILAVISLQTTSVSGNANSRYLSEALVLLADQVESFQAMNFSNTALANGATGSSQNGVYTISWTVTDNTIPANSKTITVTVSCDRLQTPPSFSIIKAQDI